MFWKKSTRPTIKKVEKHWSRDYSFVLVMLKVEGSNAGIAVPFLGWQCSSKNDYTLNVRLHRITNLNFLKKGVHVVNNVDQGGPRQSTDIAILWGRTLKALYHHHWRAPRLNTFGGQECPANTEGQMEYIQPIEADLKWKKVKKNRKSIHLPSKSIYTIMCVKYIVQKMMNKR